MRRTVIVEFDFNEASFARTEKGNRVLYAGFADVSVVDQIFVKYG